MPGPRAVAADSRSAVRTLSRGQLFAGVCFLNCLNGVSGRILASVKETGWVYATLDTFNVSAIVWIPIFYACIHLSRSFPAPAGRVDLAVAALGVLCALTPVVPLSWMALTATSLWLMWASRSGSDERRATSILLTVTLPMFWSPWLFFHVLARYVLVIDAMAVSTVLGSSRQGNAVAFADGSGYLKILYSCSSVTNVSLAILAWVTIGQMVRRPTTAASLAWCAAACIAVMTVNVTRISLIGFFPASYQTIHGPFGSTIAGWLTLALILGIVALSARRELQSRL